MGNGKQGTERSLNQRFLNVNGQRLHFIDWSPASESAIILLHGMAMHARVWDDFAISLDSNYRPIAVDFRGHGDSDWSADQRYDRMTLAADIGAFIPEVSTNPPVVIGHSLGGAVGLLGATTWRRDVAPKAIVMIDSSLSKPSGQSRVGQFLDQSPTSFDSLEAMIDYAATLAKGRTRTELRTSVLRNARKHADGRWAWKYDPALVASRRQTPSDSYDQLWHALEALTVPLLYIKASHNSHLQEDQERRLGSVNPLVQLVEAPNTTHAVMRDNPTAFRTLVMSFLESLG